MPALPTAILRYLTSPGGTALARGNIVFAALLAGFTPLAGSGVSVVVAVTMCWGILLLAGKRLAFPAQRQAWLAAGAFALFFITEALATGLSGFSSDGMQEIAENLPFLGVLPLFALMTARPATLLRTLYLAAAAGGLLAGAAALGFLLFQPDKRLELMAGNPLVLALAASVMNGLALAGALRLRGWERNICLAGAMAAAFLVISSESRTYWFGLLAMPVAMAAVHMRATRTKALVLAGMVLTAGATAFLAYTYLPVVQERIEAVSTDLEKARNSDLNTSLGQRFVVWETARQLIREKPVFGHGGGDIPGLMAERNAETGGYTFAFTHFHNAILNVLVRGGIVNLAGFLAAFLAPLVLLWINRHSVHGRAALTAGIALYLPYCLSGVTGLVFGHDIHDALFIGLSVVCLQASFPGQDDERQGDDGQAPDLRLAMR